MDLLKQDFPLDARAELSTAFFSGSLDAPRKARALKSLSDLAARTLLSSDVYEGDPYTGVYTIAKGDLILRLVQKEKLQVPPAIIERVNGVDGDKLRIGRTIKFIRGPAHAVVNKDDFTMDLYFQREGQPKAFIKRLRVGLGKDGGTPLGSWVVARKSSHSRWQPPPSAKSSRPIDWGQAGYPLGKEGYWIGLQGTDETTRGQDGYGIHGTDDPASIGKAASLGCIRLADEDIEFVYSLLVEKVSTVIIRP